MDPAKLYVEYYAKLHAERAMRLWPMRLFKSERPDFLSKRRELGMEVTRAAIEELVRRADLLIGTVLIPGAAAPKLVTHGMVRSGSPCVARRARVR